MRRKSLLTIVTLLIGLSQAFPQDKQEPAKWKSPGEALNTFNLFEDEDILELSLKFDITWFLQNKPEKNMDAILSYRYSESDSLNLNIKLRARGNFRYNNCIFPPLRLDFDDIAFSRSDLNNIRDIKLVTHCDSSEMYQQYLFREYLVYKLLNIVSDYSFRVRLLKIRYIDIGSGSHSFEHFAFALEPMDVLLDRLGATEVEDTVPVFETVDRDILENISLFQYMIGNSDWNLPLMHNLRLISLNGSNTGKLIALPYDFDYCGFVNTHYAMARTDLGLESVRDRVYLGPCIESGKLKVLLKEFEAHRDKFLSTIRNFVYLDGPDRRDLEKYITSFYKEYRNDMIETNIEVNCLNK